MPDEPELYDDWTEVPESSLSPEQIASAHVKYVDDLLPVHPMRQEDDGTWTDVTRFKSGGWLKVRYEVPNERVLGCETRDVRFERSHEGIRVSSINRP
jgi:hypothetical protein